MNLAWIPIWIDPLNPNKYQKEIIKLKSQRDKSILGQIELIFDSIRDKSQSLAMKVTDKAADNKEYFQERNRAELFAKEVNDELRPLYTTKDYFSKKVYTEEFSTSYIQSLYSVVNTGIEQGYLVKLPKFTAKQFERAVKYPLSKLINNTAMQGARNTDIHQIYTTIVSGVESGLSLPNINKNIDVALGYRDSLTGKWIQDAELRKGQNYRTMSILRTENARMRNTAETDQWINQQDIVESKLQALETLDDRTRSQSANMDGDYANKEGKFLYPDGNWYYLGRSGIAKYDINERGTTITVDLEFPPESRIKRDKDGNNIIEPYTSFKQYAEDNGLTINKYGEVLFK